MRRGHLGLPPAFPGNSRLPVYSVVLLITLKMSDFKKRTGRKYQSDAFSAEGDHTFSDFLSSVSVWITLLLGYFGIHIERYITFLIGIMVLNIGIKLFFRSIKTFGIKIQTAIHNNRQAPIPMLFTSCAR